MFIDLLPLAINITQITSHDERLKRFRVDDLLSFVQIRSFWYEYNPKLRLFVNLLSNVTASFSSSFRFESSLVRYPLALTIGTLYAFNPDGASKKVEEVSKNLDPQFARFIWNLPQNPFVKFMDTITNASVAVAKTIRFHVKHPPGEINVRLISANPLTFQLPNTPERNLTAFLSSKKLRQSQKNRTSSLPPVPSPELGFQSLNSTSLSEKNGKSHSVILHFHGGGFISMSPESHENYLRDWANIAKTVILSVDYRQAPEYKYPVALDDCWEVYSALIDGTLLGFFPSKIALAGDSAGGNLVSAVTLRALSLQKRVPDSIVLIYPAINLCKVITPSKLFNMNDPIVSFQFLSLCLDSYLTEDAKPQEDFLLSPFYAPEEYLKKFPTTYVMGASYDPLLDDYTAFVKKLRDLGKLVLFKVYDDLPHGFLNMAKMIPGARKPIEDSGLWLQWSVS